VTYELYNADCLDILPTLEPGSVDAVICDPPYGTTACKWDSVIPFAPMWEGIKRVLKPRGACVLFGSQPFTSALVMSNPGWFKYTWVWEKGRASNFILARVQPLKIHEDIVVFCSGKPTYNWQAQSLSKSGIARNNRAPHTQEKPITGRTSYVGATDYHGVTEGYPKSILRFNSEFNNQFIRPVAHPMQKPPLLMEYLVRTYTNEGDCVLDFTMGSGTTGHACGNLDRRFIGIEQDAGYFAIAQERIATAYEPLRAMQTAV